MSGLPAAVTNRAVQRRVVALLRSYVDALDSWDDGASGGGVKLMPSMWNEGSYVELERALRSMRDAPQSRRWWWHVSARYLWTTSRIATVTVRRTRLGPVAVAPRCSEIDVVLEMSGSSARARIIEWSDRVDLELVALGVEYLAETMYAGDHGRVVLPRALVARLSTHVADDAL